MKFLICRVKQKKDTRIGELTFERVIFFAFIAAFTLLVVVQAALISPSVKTFVNESEEFDGTPLGIEEYLYQEGEIRLKLLKGDPDGSVKILLNGDEAAVFNSQTQNLTVKDGDIVEIDGSEAENDVEVAIVGRSDNIVNDSVNKMIRVKSEVKPLAQIRME